MIEFPYQIKRNIKSNNTFIEPTDVKEGHSHDLKTLCDTLHKGYSELVETAIDNKPIFINHGISHINAKGKKCVSKPQGEGLKKLFTQRHPQLTVNPNPKNTKGEKGQSMYRLINGNLGKLYRIMNDNQNLSIEMLDMLNKMNDMIAEHIITRWEDQDDEVIKMKIPVKQHKQEEIKKDDFLKELGKLKVDHYDPLVRLAQQQNQKLFNTGLFDADDNNGDAV